MQFEQHTVNMVACRKECSTWRVTATTVSALWRVDGFSISVRSSLHFYDFSDGFGETTGLLLPLFL